MSVDDLELRVARLERALLEFSNELRLALRYVRPDAGSSLTKSRMILEKLVVRIYQSEIGREPKKPLLGEMLADNQFTRKLERRILSRMNSIRDMGNLGPHGEPVEAADAARVLEDLCDVLDWYLQRYSQAPCRDQVASEGNAPSESAEGLIPGGTARPVNIEPPCKHQSIDDASNEGIASGNLLHVMWESLDASLQDAFSLAYNKKRRQGGNRISTKDFFQALARLEGDPVRSLIESLPEDALPEAIDLSVSRDPRPVQEESPLLSDCVADSLQHFRELENLPRRISASDMFVDIAKFGHGESVSRLRKHGVGKTEIEQRVHGLGLAVLRRKGA